MTLSTLAGRSRRVTFGAAATAALLLGGMATIANATGTITSLDVTSGPLSGGSGVVTITGTGFSGIGASEKVWFGSTAAPGFLVESGTKLLVTPPAHAPGVVDITIGNAPGSATATTADNYTYTAAPVISGVTLVEGATVGKKDTLAIAGSQLLGASLVLVGDTTVKVVYPKGVPSPHTDSLLKVKAPNVKSGSVTVAVVTPQGIGSRANAYGAAPVVSKLFVPSTVDGKVVQTVVSRGSDLGGRVVHVAGSGFTGVTSFSFGAASTTNFVVLSDTEAKVVVPAKAAGDAYLATAPNTLKVKVVAVNPYSGTFADAKGGSFQYDAEPTVTSASRQRSQATATTTTVDFSGAFLKGATVKFGTAAGKVTSTNLAGTTITVTVPAGTVTVPGAEADVVITTAAGSVTLPKFWTFTSGVTTANPWTRTP
jgi:hypothetical protein